MSKKIIEITLTEPLLGTLSGDKEIATEFIASKHSDGVQDDELVASPDATEKVEKMSTFFPRNGDKIPFFWDYQIKGFLKGACSMLRRIKDNKNEKLKAYKKVIDGLIFPGPRQIPLVLPDGTDPDKLEFCERPLRAQTPKGERIALARSEMAPAGTKLNFYVEVLDDKYWEYVESWLNYGKFLGLGQWRNSGMGRFTWRYLPVK